MSSGPEVSSISRSQADRVPSFPEKGSRGHLKAHSLESLEFKIGQLARQSRLRRSAGFLHRLSIVTDHLGKYR